MERNKERIGMVDKTKLSFELMNSSEEKDLKNFVNRLFELFRK